MWKLITPFAVIVLALLAAIYYDDTPADADLVFVNRSDIFTLDPQRMSYVQDFRMAYGLYEGLVRWNNTDFTIEPALAAVPTVEDGTISEDRMRYRFTIRDDARWSNGAPVTAHDFVYSWQRLILPDTAADYSNLFFVVKGAREYWDWRSAQLRAMAADPWSADDADLAEHAEDMHRRLTGLIAMKTVPDGLAMLPASDRSMCRGELAQLADTFGGLSSTAALREQCGRMPYTRRWYDALAAGASQDAEARWAWAEAQRMFDELVGVKAIDARTVELSLESPCAYFLDLLAFAVAYPVYRPCVEGWPPSMADAAVDEPRGWAAVEPPPFDECRFVSLDAATGRLHQKHEWARPGRLVSSGPYILTQWRYKRDIRLERNPFYHTPEMAKPDSIVARAIEDTNTAVLAFESGHIDWLSDVSADYQADMLLEREAFITAHEGQYNELIAAGHSVDEALALLDAPRSGERRNIHKFATFGTDFYSFNCRPTLADGRDNPFAIAAVRRGFARATDKRPIVQSATRLDEPISHVLIPPGSIPGYDSPEGVGFDLEQAHADLASVGWVIDESTGLLTNRRTREQFPTVEILWTTNTPRYKWISLELKSQWERNLGIRVELVGRDTKFYKEDLKKGNFMVARGRWYGDYGDPTTFLDLCRSTDGNNDRGYKSAEIDGMLDAAAAEPDPEKRMAILEQCEAKLFNEEVPMLPICQLVQVYMYEPGEVTGLSAHPRLTQYLWQMDVKEGGR